MVTAAFFNFSPALVRASIPAAWDRLSPADTAAARLAVADRAFSDPVVADQAVAAGPSVAAA